MVKVSVYLDDIHVKFLDSVTSGGNRSEKMRLLFDQLINGYRKGFLSESELKYFRQRRDDEDSSCIPS